jgi:hypothetical protein
MKLTYVFHLVQSLVLLLKAFTYLLTYLPKPCIYFSPIRATCPTHLNLIYLITLIIFNKEYRSLSSSLRSFLHSPVTSSLLGPNILLNTLFSKTLDLRFFLNLSDQVLHTHKTIDKNIILYILIFKVLDCNLEDKRFCIP